MQKITPCLWFNNNVEEAVEFYTSIFKNSSVGKTARYDKESSKVSGMPEGSILTCEFKIENYHLLALNGGPLFKFNPSISFMVGCTTKEEVDGLYEKLVEGGEVLMPLDSYPFSERYAWIADKYGVSWQLIFSEKAPKEKIIPSLLFTQDKCGRAEEAINFYISIFKDSKMKELVRYPAGMDPEKEGTIMYADFVLEKQTFAAMDSAQEHKFVFNEAISFIINCDSQEEVDHYWKALSAVPESEQCGWLKDKFGVSWQVVPIEMEEMLADKDKEKSRRVMSAMLEMKKLDIKKLRDAYEGKTED